MATQIRNLVFEGGGVKGIAYGGALSKLESRGILEGVTRVAGTSAGGITAVLLAFGYRADEVSEIVAGTNFNDFADQDLGIIRDLYRLIRKYGFHKGDKFRNWIGKLIARKAGRKDTTFGQLQQRVGQNGFRSLYMVGTNLSGQSVDIYSHETEPDMQIRDATRITMSIPIYFQSVRRDKEVLVDGGVAWNYPINIFDLVKYVDDAPTGSAAGDSGASGSLINRETLGFRLDTREEIDQNGPNWANVPKDIRNMKDYVAALFGFMFESLNKRHLGPEDWERTVFIETGGVKATDFDLPSRQIEMLIKKGEEGVEAYFDWLDNREEPGLGLESP